MFRNMTGHIIYSMVIFNKGFLKPMFFFHRCHIRSCVSIFLCRKVFLASLPKTCKKESESIKVYLFIICYTNFFIYCESMFFQYFKAVIVSWATVVTKCLNFFILQISDRVQIFAGVRFQSGFGSKLHRYIIGTWVFKNMIRIWCLCISINKILYMDPSVQRESEPLFLFFYNECPLYWVHCMIFINNII